MSSHQSSIESILPQWHTRPQRPSFLDVYKNGKRVDEINLGARDYTVFGRSPDFSDVILEHQSISRKHAVTFFKGELLYLMDLGSGHGTSIGDNEVAKMCAIEVKDGHQITFGKSSRNYVVRIESSSNKIARPPVPSFASGETGPNTSDSSSNDGFAVPSLPTKGTSSAPVTPAVPASVSASVPENKTKSTETNAAAGSADKNAERLARQREIAAFAAEMMGSEAKIKSHPKGLFATLDIKSFKTLVGKSVADDEEDGPVLEDNDDDSDEGFEKSDHEAGDTIDNGKDGDDEDDDEGFVDNENDPHVVDESEPEEVADQMDSVEAFCTARKVPVSHQVDLTGHAKAVTCVSIEPAGNRVVTGSLDYNVKLFDFGGMDSRHRSFRSMEPQDGYPVVSVSHSPSGDRFVVGLGSAQPRVYDREGVEILKFIKGDMYLRDLSNTKGHTMEISAVQWHPTEKNTILTSSLDGSLRIWDLEGPRIFDHLVCKSVLKIRAVSVQNRIGATSCGYSPTGNRIFGGAADGTIHIWQERKIYSRADAVIRPAHREGCQVSCVVVSSDGKFLASRGEDRTIRLWDLAGAVMSTAVPKLLKVFSDLPNIYPSANVEFSPDSKLLCCGTTPEKQDDQAKSLLCFFEVEDAKAIEPVLKIGVAAGGVSAVRVKWQKNTNQIFCSTSGGYVRVFFDPRFSKKGALLSASKVPKREKDPQDSAAIGEIYCPNSLPMYKTEPFNKKRSRDLKDPIKNKIPEKQKDKGPGRKPNNSFFFTKLVTEGKVLDTTRSEDPREALLKMDAKAKADPIFFGRAYEGNQPSTELHTLTFEEEQEEFKKRQKTMI